MQIFDDPGTADEKIEKLAEFIKAANHVVVHTGNGLNNPDIWLKTTLWRRIAKSNF